MSKLLIGLMSCVISMSAMAYEYNYRPSNIGDVVIAGSTQYKMTGVPLSIANIVPLPDINDFALVIPLPINNIDGVKFNYSTVNDTKRFGRWAENYLVYVKPDNEYILQGIGSIDVNMDYDIDSEDAGVMTVNSYASLALQLNINRPYRAGIAIIIEFKVPCKAYTVNIEDVDDYSVYMDWNMINQCKLEKNAVGRLMDYVHLLPR